MNSDVQKRAVDAVVSRFFLAFNNEESKPAALDSLRDLFIEKAVIVKTCGATPVTYNIDEFLAPRQELLNGGDLKEFSEQELWERTFIFGCIAQRVCAYRKSGELHGKKFATDGMKSIQLVNTGQGWKITAVVWDDERQGLSVPPYFEQ